MLRPDSVVLDLACGAGWLTGMLSARDDVSRVIASDASPRLLADVLPEMVPRVGGDLHKVEPVCGMFLPLLLDDASVDCVVMASAFHHCDDPGGLLSDLRRVLRPGGVIVLLNEVPYRRRAMWRWIATTAIAATVNSTFTGTRLRKRGTSRPIMRCTTRRSATAP